VEKAKAVPKIQRLAITGCGMVSSLGLDVDTSCAAARAGLTRTSELSNFQLWDEELQEPALAVGCILPEVADGFEGLAKIVRLGSLALKDCLQRYPGSLSFDKAAVLIALADKYHWIHAKQARIREEGESEESGQDEETSFDESFEVWRETLPTLVLKECGVTAACAAEEVSCEGEPGIASLLMTASQILNEQSINQCILGGISSNVEISVLDILRRLNFLKGPENPEGIIPGEAAAFVVLETMDHALNHRRPVLAILETLSVDEENVHRFSNSPSAGVALSSVINKVVEELPEVSRRLPSFVIGNLNGDRWRAHEWGNALSRLRIGHELENIEVWYPALHFGEIGSATPFVSICMAITAFQRGYAPEERSLVWLSADNGSKTAFTVAKNK
jgi:3-oxoacyl-[acyl-carrier-protein] synthase-1